MSQKRRIDGPDTIDNAVSYLMVLAKEGWAVQRLEHEIEYFRVAKKSPEMPMAATVTIRLVAT